MFEKQKVTIKANRLYAKPYVQKIKSVIWNKFEAVCEVVDNSFDTDEDVTIELYFLATEQQLDSLTGIIERNFGKGLEIEYYTVERI